MRIDAGVRVAVAPGAANQASGAAALASALDLPLLRSGISPRHCQDLDILLLLLESGPALQLTGPAAPGPVTVDFASPALRHRRRGGQNELLGKAVGLVKRPGLTVMDATAGLGRDAFVLADLDCRVVLYERNPLIHTLLEQGLLRALQSSDPWIRQVARRMRLVHGVACEVDAGALGCDVIYLDPMFPLRNKSAAVKNEMALYQ